MNIFKKIQLLCIVLSTLILFNCSKDLHFSGISENSVNLIYKNYQTTEYSKEEISKIIGAPLVEEDEGNLWIYRLKKEIGNSTFKKTIYNKTLKLKFKNNILRSVEEINLN